MQQVFKFGLFNIFKGFNSVTLLRRNDFDPKFWTTVSVCMDRQSHVMGENELDKDQSKHRSFESY